MDVTCFMKHRAAAALHAHIAVRSKSHKRLKEGMRTFYCEAVNFLLETYVTDDVIAETDVDIMPFTRLLNKWPTDWGSNKTLQSTIWCDR